VRSRAGHVLRFLFEVARIGGPISKDPEGN
jgi:hypothetical protein